MGKIAVIGDTALDFSYFTHVSEERSAETGLAVNYTDKILYDAGGAGNLASDIAALGWEADLYGIVGNDFWAELLTEKLRENGVGTEHLHRAAKAETYVYHRIFDENGKELPRYDCGQGCVYEDGEAVRLLEELEENIESYSALIINQQLSRSIHTEAFTERLNKIVAKTKIPVWEDTRSEIRYPGCSYKINLTTAAKLTGENDPEACVRAICSANCRAGKAGYTVITLGENGAVAYDGETLTRCEGIKIEGEKDTIGCGDAFMAALCCRLCEGGSIDAALQHANRAGAECAKYIHRCGHPAAERE